MYLQTNAPIKRRPLLLFCAALLALNLAGGAMAQVGNQPATVTSNVPTFAGAMLQLRVATPTLVRFGTVAAPLNWYLPGGRFQIQTATSSPTGGNPTRAGDENRLIGSWAEPYTDPVPGWQYTDKVTIAIDPTPAAAGQLATGLFYDPHALMALEASEALVSSLVNFWVAPPSPGTRDVSGTFRVPAVDYAPGDTVTEWLTVRQVQTVIGDTVQIEYIVTNTSTQRHQVGLRVFVDSTFGGGSNLDGRSIVLPDGRVIDSEKTLPDPSVANDVMPDYWTSYDNSTSPNCVLRGKTTGAEVTNPGIANSAAGPPNAISFGQYRNIGQDNQYYFTPNTQASLIGEDWGYAVLWDAKELVPGESRRYVTYYGMGASAADYDSPYALMAYSPFSLKSHAGNDPATPDVTESYYLTDDLARSPFPISVYMDNFGTTPIFDASCRVRLPVDLDLASGDTPTKSAGIVQRNEIKSLSWNVLATNARPGIADIRFTGPLGKVVTRHINIPAVPVLNPLPGSTNGLEMVSIPFEFANSDAEWVFQTLVSLLPGGPASLIRYDPTITDYRWFPDPSVVTVTPGKGFWLLNRNRTPVVMPSDATPVDDTRTYSVDVKTGWNQIGNPFTSSVRMDHLRVAGLNGGEWSLEEAVSRDMLLPTVYAYDPATNSYTWELLPNETYLDPYTGYWLLARQDSTLLFTPPTMFASGRVGGASPASATAPARGVNNWKLDLRVNVSGAAATTQTLGVRSGAAKGLDRYDVPEPPASLKREGAYLHSAFYPGPSAVGTPYLADTRAPAQAAQEWYLVVKTNAVNSEVAVTWPSLEALPSGLVATLVDEATGDKRYMRTTNSYSIRTGSQPTERVLKVIVQPRPTQSLAVPSVKSVSTGQGSAAISYTLSSDAAVDVRIRNIAGQVISNVASGQLAPAGLNTILWGGRSNRGSFVPGGRYLCEIIAKSPLTGQSVSVVYPLSVKR